jgi:hypothetical protein
LHRGANLIDGKFVFFSVFFLITLFNILVHSSLLVSKALGHSSVAVTSIYLHSSGQTVSELIDLSASSDSGSKVDDSITYVKTESKLKKKKKLIEKSKLKKIKKSEI